MTPLHYAAGMGFSQVVEMLLETIPGSDKNPRDMFGTTPMHQAAKAGHLRDTSVTKPIFGLDSVKKNALIFSGYFAVHLVTLLF